MKHKIRKRDFFWSRVFSRAANIHFLCTVSSGLMVMIDGEVKEGLV